MIRLLTEKDIEMYCLLEQIKQQTSCIDKQVACIITDGKEIKSIGYNTVQGCDKDCYNPARICFNTHAETMAFMNLKAPIVGPLYIYLNLFPCGNCQKIISQYNTAIAEVIIFSSIHKQIGEYIDKDKLTVFDNIGVELLNFNKDKQLFVAMGELAELITAIADSKRRDVRNDRNIIEELVDVELQINQIKRYLYGIDKDFITIYKNATFTKYSKLFTKFSKTGLSSLDIYKYIKEKNILEKAENNLLINSLDIYPPAGKKRDKLKVSSFWNSIFKHLFGDKL